MTTSVVYILGFNYGDHTTITTLFTNIWFSWSKLASGMNVATLSLRDGIGYSYYNTLNLSYNRIDVAYKKHISSSNIHENSSHANSHVVENEDVALPASDSRLEPGVCFPKHYRSHSQIPNILIVEDVEST
jgi:hypothetical protein